LLESDRTKLRRELTLANRTLEGVVRRLSAAEGKLV
jgi:hypothetical protein